MRAFIAALATLITITAPALAEIIDGARIRVVDDGKRDLTAA